MPLVGNSHLLVWFYEWFWCDWYRVVSGEASLVHIHTLAPVEEVRITQYLPVSVTSPTCAKTVRPPVPQIPFQGYCHSPFYCAINIFALFTNSHLFGQPIFSENWYHVMAYQYRQDGAKVKGRTVRSPLARHPSSAKPSLPGLAFRIWGVSPSHQSRNSGVGKWTYPPPVVRMSRFDKHFCLVGTSFCLEGIALCLEGIICLFGEDHLNVTHHPLPTPG